MRIDIKSMEGIIFTDWNGAIDLNTYGVLSNIFLVLFFYYVLTVFIVTAKYWLTIMYYAI